MPQVDWGAKPTAKKNPPAAPDLNKLVTGKGGLKRLNANIPEDVHADFKANVARKKGDMTKILIKLIMDWNEENQP
jgi:hypothetical protein